MIHKSAQNTAKVTLSDCLACSGCITSAETVLISQQSVQTLQEKLDQGCEVTVSISQQSLLSISKRLGQSVSLTGKLLSGALRKKGIFQVLSMDHARDAVLKAAFEEFWERFQSAQMPLLSSECPGWLCYALKKGDEKLVNFMSKVKTPMLVQRELKGVHGFHIAVMPCYDKKLEAVMENGVDLVLTTTELLEFCGELSEEGDFDDFFSSVPEKSSSLGYAEFIFHKTVKLLYGESSEVRFKSTVRRDVLEIEYKDLKFCIASGFQNIQNVIRSLKTGKCKYQYIEIMACPMGCLNGGGQFRTSREEVLALESVTSDYYKQTLEESPVINAERELKLLNTNKLKW